VDQIGDSFGVASVKDTGGKMMTASPCRMLLVAILALFSSPTRADIYPRDLPTRAERDWRTEEDWHRPRILLSGAFAAPVGPTDLARYWNPGPGWGFGTVAPWTPFLALSIRVESASLSFDPGALRAARGLDPATPLRAESASVFAAMVGLRVNRPAEGLRPYAELGIGLPVVTVPWVSYDDPVRGPGSAGGQEIFGFDPGGSLGLGIEWFRPTAWGAYLEARIVDAPARTLPAHVWVPVELGVTLRMPPWLR